MAKKSCWRVLGLGPTGDVQAVKNAYRRLMREHHPDYATTPEQERKKTLKCIEINEAYDEAINQAPALSKSAGIPSPTTDTGPGELWVYLGSFVGCAGGLALVIGGWVGATLLVSLPDSNPVKIVFSLVIITAVAGLVGFVVMGVVDLAIMFLIPSRLLARIGLEKYEDKILWVLIVLTNIILFTVGPFGATFDTPTTGIEKLGRIVWISVGAGFIPVYFGYDWLKTKIDFRRKSEAIVVMKKKLDDLALQ